MSAAQGFGFRNRWVNPKVLPSDEDTIQWLNEFIWNLLSFAMKQEAKEKTLEVKPLPKADLQIQQFCLQVLQRQELLGLVLSFCGQKATEVFGSTFEIVDQISKQRTDVYLQALSLMQAPEMEGSVLPIENAASRRLYEYWGVELKNPRRIDLLSIWVATVDLRQKVFELLLKDGYTETVRDEDYLFSKAAHTVPHVIQIRSRLWEGSKSWHAQTEHEIWNRSHGELKRELDITDHFILQMRFYTIDTLFGSALHLLDLALMLQNLSSSIDWDRIYKLKSLYPKPNWIWSGFLALEMFEKKTGIKFNYPEWIRPMLEPLQTTFWVEYLASRFTWANQVSRSQDHIRAFSKLLQGI